MTTLLERYALAFFIALFLVLKALVTFTHSHADGGGCYALCQLYIWCNLGFSIFLNDTSTHSSTQPGGAGIRTSNLPITRQPATPTELQTPQISCSKCLHHSHCCSSRLLSFQIPYIFQHVSPPSNFVLNKPFKYQNVQLFKDITACIFLFSTSTTLKKKIKSVRFNFNILQL